MAWTLSESGSIGVLLRLGTGRSPLDPLKQPAVAVIIERSSNGNIMCSCSSPEICRGPSGYLFDKDVAFAMRKVRSAMEVTMKEVFEVLSSTLRPSSLEPGSAVAYGKSLCVVRCGESSWPVAVVGTSAADRWLCVSCATANVECPHRMAAQRAVSESAVREADDEYDPSSPAEDSGDEVASSVLDAVAGNDVPSSR